ncbi:MAG TPA: ABC transporter substrate-binding protein, partial [Mycobacterium sp.]
DSMNLVPGNDMSWVSNPVIDAPLKEIAAASEVEQQKHLYDQVQQLVAQNAYHLGLYPQTTRLVSKKHLQDVWIEPSEGEPVLHDAWLAK